MFQCTLDTAWGFDPPRLGRLICCTIHRRHIDVEELSGRPWTWQNVIGCRLVTIIRHLSLPKWRLMRPLLLLCIPKGFCGIVSRMKAKNPDYEMLLTNLLYDIGEEGNSQRSGVYTCIILVERGFSKKKKIEEVAGMKVRCLYLTVLLLCSSSSINQYLDRSITEAAESYHFEKLSLS